MPEDGKRSNASAARPDLGQAVKEAISAGAWRRDGDRSLRPLKRLWPLLASHWPDALLGLTFLLLSTAALLALTGGARMVLDQGFGLQSRNSLIQVFLWLGLVAAALAVTTGLRLYFTYKLGERIIADLRQEVFRHVLGLDLAHFVELKTGEVL
jgi:ATP-binding cassette subfamily B protein